LISFYKTTNSRSEGLSFSTRSEHLEPSGVMRR
jgi:hypothetical protein